LRNNKRNSKGFRKPLAARSGARLAKIQAFWRWVCFISGSAGAELRRITLPKDKRENGVLKGLDF